MGVIRLSAFDNFEFDNRNHDILSPRAFRKYTIPMVFREFLKNPTYPKIWGLSAYPLLTISNLTTGIIIFDILSPRAFGKYTTPMVFREFLKNPTYPKIWGLSAYPLLTILNLTTGIIIFDILSPRAFRKY